MFNNNLPTPQDPQLSNPQPPNPRAWLAVLIVGGVVIAFLVTSVMPEHENFALLWPVVQAAFWLVVVSFFAIKRN